MEKDVIHIILAVLAFQMKGSPQDCKMNLAFWRKKIHCIFINAQWIWPITICTINLTCIFINFTMLKCTFSFFFFFLLFALKFFHEKYLANFQTNLTLAKWSFGCPILSKPPQKPIKMDVIKKNKIFCKWQNLLYFSVDVFEI